MSPDDVPYAALHCVHHFKPFNVRAHKNKKWNTERCPPQPVSSQMLHASGECEGGCLDCGRGWVLQAKAAEGSTRAAAADAGVRPPAQTYSRIHEHFEHLYMKNTDFLPFYT